MINSRNFVVENSPETAGRDQPEAGNNVVSAEYFNTLQIKLVKGRYFDGHDRMESPPVVIINELMAKRYWPDTDPVSKRLQVFSPGGQASWATVVGVVGNVNYMGLDVEPRYEMYFPLEQKPWSFVTMLVRTRTKPEQAAAIVRQEVWNADKDQPVSEVATMDALVSRSVAEKRLAALLIVLFAVVGLVITCVGIYGVVSYAVLQRSHDIGIRIALGAEPRDVSVFVLRQGLLPVGLGAALGAVGAAGSRN